MIQEKNEMLRMALKYRRELNWCIIPLRERSKSPLVKWKRFQQQMVSIEEIVEWFTQWPANIGVLSGLISKHVVIDVDKPEGQDFIDAHGGFPGAPKCNTVRGSHFYLQYPIDSKIANVVDKELGIEVKSDGLLTMVPPSVHPEGKRYGWIKGRSPFDIPLPPIPVWVIEFVKTRQGMGSQVEVIQTADWDRRIQRIIAIRPSIKKIWDNPKPEDRSGHDWALLCSLFEEGFNDHDLLYMMILSNPHGKAASRNDPKRYIEDLISNCGKKFNLPVDQGQQVELRKLPDDKTKPEQFSRYNLVSGNKLLTMKRPKHRWLWDGKFPSGGLGLLVSKPKAGKTVFAINLGVNVSRGTPFLDSNTTQGPAIYLALEESWEEVQENFLKMGGDFSNIHFHFGSAPEEALKELVKEMEARKPKLVIIDILQKFLRFQKIDDYAESTTKLDRAMEVARKLKCFILLLHHSGKKEREIVDAALGSIGLTSGVDTVVEIKKDKNERRTYSTLQRYHKAGEKDIDNMVIKLAPDGITLHLAGSVREVNISEVKEQILGVLKDIREENSYTEPQIREEIKRDKRLCLQCLKELHQEAKIQRGGKGIKNDPYKYWIKQEC